MYKLPAGVALKSWYPPHMDKGMRYMQTKLRRVDFIIEVHDARIPLSGRNIEFYNKLYSVKPHVLVLNKVELVNRKYCNQFEEQLKASGKVETIQWISCKSESYVHSLKTLMDTVIDKLEKEHRFSRTAVNEYVMMVIGIPNTGKSSLINALRKHNLNNSRIATIEGNRPGVTKNMQNLIKVSEKPRVYLIDTPGVVCPRIVNPEEHMKIALCAAVSPKSIGYFGVRLLADYLLYWLNKHENFDYVYHCGLSAPSDNIMEVLLNAAMLWGFQEDWRSPDRGLFTRPSINQAAEKFLNLFRDGVFGRVTLDIDFLLKKPLQDNLLKLRGS